MILMILWELCGGSVLEEYRCDVAAAYVSPRKDVLGQLEPN